MIAQCVRKINYYYYYYLDSRRLYFTFFYQFVILCYTKIHFYIKLRKEVNQLINSKIQSHGNLQEDA